MKWLMFAWKNVMRNRRRSLTAMLITALGTAAVLASGGFALYTYESLEEMTARDTGHVVVAHARGFEGDEDVPLQHGLADAAALAEKFAALPEVRAVAPRVQFSGLISNGDKSWSSSAAAWCRKSTSACAGRK
jgi:putative ABC transport system permease protein